MRYLLTLVLSATVLVGCGGRSGLFPWHNGYSDGSPPPKKDAAVTRDGFQRRDGRMLRDVRVPRDRATKDACLPIPAYQVQGSYTGNWEGIWKCSNQKGTTINGTLQFTLTPSGSPDSFKVKGGMKGMVLGGFPFYGDIQGTMGCTSLWASMPKIVVGSGGLIYELTGDMSGQFVAQPVRSFTSGSWTAKEVGGSGNCFAQGSWKAKHL